MLPSHSNAMSLYPVSCAEERLWFLHHLAPDDPVYNTFVCFRARGPLDVDALRGAYADLAARHAALRTTYAQRPEGLVQVVASEGTIPFAEADLEPAAPNQEAELLRLANAELRRQFHLDQGPLARATLYCLGPQDHVVLLVWHHIIVDIMSLPILHKDLEALYEARRNRRPATLAELPMSFGEFARNQREQLRTTRFDAQLAYWKTQLGGNLPVLQMPTDRPRPAVQANHGAWYAHRLPPEMNRRLKDLAGKEGVSFFMLMLAAYQSFLQRYSGQDDIIVGTPIQVRTAQTKGLIGCLLNTLALRADLAGDPTFRELLQQVREVCLSAYSHSDLPFERLVEVLQPDRSLGRNVLFQTYFAMIHEGAHAPRLGELACEFLGPPALHNGCAKVDLNFVVEETGRELILALEYNTDLFDQPTVARMLRHFDLLLGGLVADPDRKISRLPLLDQAERSEVLGRWSAERRTYPRSHCLHEWFAQVAHKAKDRVALTCGGDNLTYAELECRANRLANYLRRLGAGPEVLVALCLERTNDMIVAILGVLKAGSAYVPLDSAYPRERLAFVIEDAAAPIVVTQAALRDRVAELQAQVVLLDDDAAKIAAESDQVPISGATPENLAYVIYTSGSTGKPKGVLVTHYNVVRLFEATDPWFGFDDRDVWTFFHSYSFDFTVWELWGALLYGGRLVMVPHEVSRSPQAFCRLLYDERVTVLNQTPSAFRQLIPAEAEIKERELALRYVIFGGEALELQSLRPWFARHGDSKPKLINMFGITETTVHVTYRPLCAHDIDTAPGSVIGRPIPDLCMYALDRHAQPVPVGVAGELYVGGAGVSRGYLNRPELTAERFVPDPFAATAGVLYRTGDLVRFLPDGDVQYLGRIDQQVQLRGFRVELGEIESALARHPAVAEVCVLAHEFAPGDMRLVAYAAVRDRSASSDALRDFLKHQLPAHMLPSAMMFLDALPLTRNGKIDRRALPAPVFERQGTPAERVTPRNETEKRIAEIWRELLRVEAVGVDESFFDIGGHSMLLVQVHTRLQSEFGDRSPSMIEMFKYPTIALLASHITGVAEAAAAPRRERVAAVDALRRQRERRQRRGGDA